MKKILKFIVLPYLCFCYISCGLNKSIDNKVRIDFDQQITGKQNLKHEINEMKITSIEFYCLWWSEEQMKKYIKADDPPPKNTYTKFDIWQYGEVNYPNPEKIDVLVSLNNGTDVPQELIVEVEMSFKVESWEKVNKNAEQWEYFFDKVQWTEKTSLPRQDSFFLPKEKKQIVFKDFAFGPVIDKYSGENLAKDDDRWPYYMRAKVILKSKDGKKIDESEKIIQIVPAD